MLIRCVVGFGGAYCVKYATMILKCWPTSIVTKGRLEWFAYNFFPSFQTENDFSKSDVQKSIPHIDQNKGISPYSELIFAKWFQPIACPELEHNCDEWLYNHSLNVVQNKDIFPYAELIFARNNQPIKHKKIRTHSLILSLCFLCGAVGFASNMSFFWGGTRRRFSWLHVYMY